MSEEQRQLSKRAQMAQRIVADADKFQVCEACGSIVASRVHVCPNCNGYRFDASREAVIEQAQLLGSRAQQSVLAEDLE